MRRDKIIVNLLFLLILFLLFYIFSPEISNFFHEMEGKSEFKPLQALFWFLSLLFKFFGNWVFCVIVYMITGGIIYLIGKRE
ncbi:MAG: hypothetical protein DRN29_05335 [Thermoplasmata archaeon]|nr:MAG: hypothetical protein DRN29_05335 [Thermoplasmata archaeon]